MKTAKLIACGRDQAVRLPHEFRFERAPRWGDPSRRPRRDFEPAATDLDTWLEALNGFDEPVMPEGQGQLQAPA
jgi:virulence-associated protein VagC